MGRRATLLGAGFLGATLATAGTARAQDVQAQVTTTTPPAVTTTAPAAPAPAPVVRTEVKVEDDTPDHDRFVGRFAVGYFGISQLPIAQTYNQPGAGGNAPATATPPPRDNVNAPIIGVRYWFQRNLGVDAGLGFGMVSGTSESVVVVNNAQTTVDTDHRSLFGFALHGGVPIAFAYGRHYTFELIPEATLGLTSGTIKAVNPPGTANPAPDTSLSGFRLDVGARVGAEISFGFMGIPELALQGSIGLYLRRETIKASQGNQSQSDGTTTFTTSVNSDPWALFVNNISALYYF